MDDKYITKIEINLPITSKSIRILSKIKDFFLDTNGIGGCTYSIPSQPPIFKGVWFNPDKKSEEVDDIIWIYGCYDIDNATIKINDVIKYLKSLIETEAGEYLAWITYSSVCFPNP